MFFVIIGLYMLVFLLLWSRMETAMRPYVLAAAAVGLVGLILVTAVMTHHAHQYVNIIVGAAAAAYCVLMWIVFSKAGR